MILLLLHFVDVVFDIGAFEDGDQHEYVLYLSEVGLDLINWFVVDGQDDVDIGEGAVLLQDYGLVGCGEFALVLKRYVVDLIENTLDKHPFVL